MEFLPILIAEDLYGEAQIAAESAYAPYSSFPVGAAVLTKSGSIFRGTNVENASYGLTVCAERIAIGNTISSGSIDIAAIAVYTKIGTGTPCGACRQFILEFGNEIIVVFKQGDTLTQMPISDLLPFAFDKAMLG
jgi:cytidine deaminase